MLDYPEPIARLVTALNRLPGIGPKTAQRLAFYLLRAPEEEAGALARAIVAARKDIRYCSVCSNLTDIDPCRICQDEERDRSVMCVVEEPRDVLALERTGQYRGLYHVLMGAISPIDGVGPEKLRINELLHRLQQGQVKELVLATNADIEGEATALYLSRLVKPLGVRVTRLAHGIPVGGDLEYADEVTLARALAGRQEIL
ncbi:MAG: recombination protein RecR [Clostridia bacterium]|nr:MAG: recombination protein RecR [Clostridia bacterium]